MHDQPLRERPATALTEAALRTVLSDECRRFACHMKRRRWQASLIATLAVPVSLSAAPATVANASSVAASKSAGSGLVRIVTPGIEGVVGRPWTVRASQAGEGQRSLPYGAIRRPAPNTLVVIGRPPNLEEGVADIANAILYRRRDTLYVIDTGATPSFRPFLRRAISRLRPFRKVVLVNTHGHPDHFGNNALVTGMKAPAVRHYMSRRDFRLADDYLRLSLLVTFQRVSGYVPGLSDPETQARSVLDPFRPLRQSVRTRRAIESLPTHRVAIGRLRTQGWKLGGNDVVLLRTAGHTPGELIVYFPKAHLLHTADETVAYYPAFPEASPGRTRRFFTRALAAAGGDDVQVLTDAHTHSILRGAAPIRRRFRSFLGGYDAYDRVVKRLLRAAAPDGATVSELMAGIARSSALRRAPGGAPAPGLLSALQVLKKLRQLHAVSTGGPRATRRFLLPSR
jgi:glyoxylase-like metal-dependent hydrolase (beta-lactamase superfamily II)